MINSRQSGFTLVEMTIALAIFSFVLVIITTNIVGLIKTQQTASASRATQQNARRALDEISRDFRQTDDFAVCAGVGVHLKGAIREQLYFTQVVSGIRRLYKVDVQEDSPCNLVRIGTPALLTASDVQVIAFDVVRIEPAEENRLRVGAEIRLTLGTANAILNANTCTAASGPYCSITTVDTAVSTRGQAAGAGE